jgi:hypothetical protein
MRYGQPSYPHTGHRFLSCAHGWHTFDPHFAHMVCGVLSVVFPHIAHDSMFEPQK